MDLNEAAKEMRRLSGMLDAGLETLRTAPADLAKAEAEYRKARARAWVEHTDGTAREREAIVDASTATLRYERDIAEGLRRAALESVRARQTQISALQSLLNAYRSEAEFVRTGP